MDIQDEYVLKRGLKILFLLLVLTSAGPVYAECVKCIVGDCCNGWSVYEDADGNRYKGAFRDGRLSGKGNQTVSAAAPRIPA